MRRIRPSRAGFTLVELLVVMILIAVLASLLLTAVSSAMRTAKNAAVSADINNLATALAAFKEKYSDYPPSRIVLSENGQYALTPAVRDAMVTSGNGTGGVDITNGALVTRSLSALRKFFPRVQFTTGPTPIWAADSDQWYDFDGNGVMATAPYVLEGDECLTFFLGGIPLNTGTADAPSWSMSGFGKVPTNPFSNNLNNGNRMYNGNRIPPLYEFRGDRLRDMDAPTADTVRFPSYHDTLATDAPFAYFSAYGGERYDPNDCNWAPRASSGDLVCEMDDAGAGPILRGFRVTFPVRTATSPDPAPLAISAAPNPYHSSPTTASTVQWHKGQSFQIISPGADGLYGLGGVYAPTAGAKMPADMTTVAGTTDASIRTRENDNITSFAGGTLD